MTSDRIGSYHRARLTWTCVILAAVFEASATTPHAHSGAAASVSAPYGSYVCPEGATAKLACALKGAPQGHDGGGVDHGVRHPWRFTPDMNDDCHARVHPRGRRHGNGSHSDGVRYAARGELFWVELQNVTRLDQGRYCCLSLELDHGKPRVARAHSHVLLTVTRRTGSLNCSHYSTQVPEGVVTAGLATAACIMAILSLPLILVLVYRQKQNARSHRRAHELVRLDSEAHGHENPVYQSSGSPPQAKVRTVSQIMTRQSSETGRHLLADPGTPCSPSMHGDVFFPSHDPIPECPDLVRV